MFLISDNGSRDESFMAFSDLSINLFSSAKLSELNFYCKYSQNKQNLFLSVVTPAVWNHCS